MKNSYHFLKRVQFGLYLLSLSFLLLLVFNIYITIAHINYEQEKLSFYEWNAYVEAYQAGLQHPITEEEISNPEDLKYCRKHNETRKKARANNSYQPLDIDRCARVDAQRILYSFPMTQEFPKKFRNTEEVLEFNNYFNKIMAFQFYIKKAENLKIEKDKVEYEAALKGKREAIQDTQSKQIKALTKKPAPSNKEILYTKLKAFNPFVNISYYLLLLFFSVPAFILGLGVGPYIFSGKFENYKNLFARSYILVLTISIPFLLYLLILMFIPACC